MNSLKTLNGSENQAHIEDDKLVALSRFYKAFNQRDLKLMKEVWMNSDESSMNNPVGGIVRGWKNIENVYDGIFNGGAKVYVEFFDFTIHSTDQMFFATGRERGYFEKEHTKIELAVRTSRIFRLENGGWKQVQHHGSIDQPDLLKEYQKAILKKNNDPLRALQER